MFASTSTTRGPKNNATKLRNAPIECLFNSLLTFSWRVSARKHSVTHRISSSLTPLQAYPFVFSGENFAQISTTSRPWASAPQSCWPQAWLSLPLRHRPASVPSTSPATKFRTSPSELELPELHGHRVHQGQSDFLDSYGCVESRARVGWSTTLSFDGRKITDRAFFCPALRPRNLQGGPADISAELQVLRRAYHDWTTGYATYIDYTSKTFNVRGKAKSSLSAKRSGSKVTLTAKAQVYTPDKYDSPSTTRPVRSSR